MTPADLIPLEVRKKLRPLTTRIRWAEAQVRRVLPQWAGGRFRADDVVARKLGPSDAREILHLIGVQATDEILDAVRTGLAAEDDFSIGLLLEGRLVARGSCSHQWKHIGIPGHWLGGTHVMHSLRRRGLGQLLTQYQLKAAARRGIAELYVNVSEHNLPSLGCYHASGFERVHRFAWARSIDAHLNSLGGLPRSYRILRREPA